MKSLALEIHGTGTHNRGAELMAIALAERMRGSFTNVRIAVARSFGTKEARARHGLFWTSDFVGGMRSRAVCRLLRSAGSSLRTSLRFVDPREIDVVLDASGFAFSDQWGARNAEALVTKMNLPERRKQALILLPQALGPFHDARVARASRELFDRSALVCARDQQSLVAASGLVDQQKLKLFPDFTLDVKPELPRGLELPRAFCGIVPNYRMLDKTQKGEKYLSFLQAAIDLLNKANLNPVFVLHDAQEDRKVIEAVNRHRKIAVIEHDDPRVLKGILGSADLVLGSRFHALVSALSQGIPCIGVGWSHKYQELFSDFGIPELLLNDIENLERLRQVVEELGTTASSASYRDRITASGRALRSRSAAMWLEVEALVQESVGCCD